MIASDTVPVPGRAREFRAFRATVLRLYAEGGAADFREVARFNEAIDESLTASMDRFAIQTDEFRDQFVGVLSDDLRTPLDHVRLHDGSTRTDSRRRQRRHSMAQAIGGWCTS